MTGWIDAEETKVQYHHHPKESTPTSRLSRGEKAQ
jgi:hypothetical protein